jgi:hypothetical protein
VLGGRPPGDERPCPWNELLLTRREPTSSQMTTFDRHVLARCDVGEGDTGALAYT